MKASKKLIGASVALVAALAVSVGSTFAWFTTNKNVTVEGIQANVTSGDSNLEVAFVWEADMDGHKVGEIGTFGYSLNLNDYLAEVLEHTKFDALTDNGELETNAWKGGTKNGAALTDKAGEDAVVASSTTESSTTTWTEGNYLTFTVRFRTTSSSTSGNTISLKLSSEKSSVTSSKVTGKYPDIFAWEDKVAGVDSITDGNKIEANAKDAIRVAFQEADVKVPVTGTDGGTSAQAGSVGFKADTTGKVWDPMKTEATSWTVKSGTKNMAQVIEEHLTGVAADSLSGMYKDPGYAVQNTDAEVIKLTKTEATGEYFMADLKVTIWIEGTDADCFNNIFGDLINIQLGFELDLQ